MGKQSDERCLTWRFATGNTKEIPGSQLSGASLLTDVLARCEGKLECTKYKQSIASSLISLWHRSKCYRDHHASPANPFSLICSKVLSGSTPLPTSTCSSYFLGAKTTSLTHLGGTLIWLCFSSREVPHRWITDMFSAFVGSKMWK